MRNTPSQGIGRSPVQRLPIAGHEPSYPRQTPYCNLKSWKGRVNRSRWRSSNRGRHYIMTQMPGSYYRYEWWNSKNEAIHTWGQVLEESDGEGTPWWQIIYSGKPRWNVAAQKSSSPEEDNRATNSSSKGQMRDSTTAQTGGRSGQESNIPQGLCSINRNKRWIYLLYIGFLLIIAIEFSLLSINMYQKNKNKKEKGRWKYQQRDTAHDTPDVIIIFSSPCFDCAVNTKTWNDLKTT